MENIRTNSCLIIRPDRKMYSAKIPFELDVNENILKMKKRIDLSVIIENMKKNFNCSVYKSNIAKASYPDDSYYYIFCESISDTNKMYNLNGSNIYNIMYNIDEIPKLNHPKCYGNCYILLIDRFDETHDCHINTFVNDLSIVWTSDGPIKRKNAIVKTSDSNDSNKSNKSCLVM